MSFVEPLLNSAFPAYRELDGGIMNEVEPRCKLMEQRLADSCSRVR
jgi:hypothetical protein